jgi:two-component system chemotaxis response regulator CheY
MMMPKALLVDDSSFMRLVIGSIIAPEGYDVTEAKNGLEAIALCRADEFDLITLDITMPDMDGITALQEIRVINPKAYIVMLSAMGQEFFVKTAIMHGANDFLIKPFRQEALRTFIRNVSPRHR